MNVKPSEVFSFDATPAEIEGERTIKRFTFRFDEIQIEGRIVRYYHAGTLIFTQVMDNAPGPGEVVVLRGFRGEMDGELT